MIMMIITIIMLTTTIIMPILAINVDTKGVKITLT